MMMVVRWTTFLVMLMIIRDICIQMTLRARFDGLRAARLLFFVRMLKANHTQ